MKDLCRRDDFLSPDVSFRSSGLVLLVVIWLWLCFNGGKVWGRELSDIAGDEGRVLSREPSDVGGVPRSSGGLEVVVLFIGM